MCSKSEGKDQSKARIVWFVENTHTLPRILHVINNFIRVHKDRSLKFTFAGEYVTPSNKLTTTV